MPAQSATAAAAVSSKSGKSSRKTAAADTAAAAAGAPLEWHQSEKALLNKARSVFGTSDYAAAAALIGTKSADEVRRFVHSEQVVRAVFLGTAHTQTWLVLFA